MGAKSSSLFVSTPDTSFLIDPGAAVMQPSYPLSEAQKITLKRKAFEEIKKYSKMAENVIITHYHYDHHTLLSNKDADAFLFYSGKILFLKDPNQYINLSQWARSRKFIKEIIDRFGKTNFNSFTDKPKIVPGHLQRFKEEIMHLNSPKFVRTAKYKWIRKMFAHWRKNPWIKEFSLKKIKLKFADGKSFKFKNTILKFTPPLFHGEEYDKIGWVIGLTIQHKREKLLYTSDIQGPVVDEVADWIITEMPKYLVIDGPPTYLLGVMFNLKNLERVINNLLKIIERANSKLIMLDHHLLREAGYREKLSKVYEFAKRCKVKLTTAAEYFKRKPLIDTLTEG